MSVSKEQLRDALGWSPQRLSNYETAYQDLSNAAIHALEETFPAWSTDWYTQAKTGNLPIDLQEKMRAALNLPLKGLKA